MKLIILFTLIISLNLNAQNLSEILESLKESKKVKAIQSNFKSKISQNELTSAYEAPELALNVSQVEDALESGMEYSVGFSQNIAHPFSSLSIDKGVDSLTSALKQELKHQVHLLELDVVSRYHETCVSKEMEEKANMLFLDQSQRFQQMQKAYDLGEISRKNLLFNKLDLVKLKKRLSRYKKLYFTDFLHLQESIDNLDITGLACDDLVELSAAVELLNINEHGEIKKIEYEEKSANSFYNAYNSSIDSLGYEIGFDQELDTQRVTIGLNIPLGGLSSAKQRKKAQYMHLSSAYSMQKDSAKELIKFASHSLGLRVRALHQEYKFLDTKVLPLNLELVNLSKSAYSEGEGTIMEYLDATRSYAENILEMLEIKKRYYKELFELYKKADLNLGEKYDKVN